MTPATFPPKLPFEVSHRRPLADDLWLPEHDTAQTVQVGHSPLPFDESDCDLPVRISELPLVRPRQHDVETLYVRRPPPDSAPTKLMRAAVDPSDDPSGLMVEVQLEEKSAPPYAFVLLLLAISVASILAGVLLAPMLAG